MWGIRFNNEKGWFEAHKEEYLTTFQRPMKALADEVYVAFTDRHPDLTSSGGRCPASTGTPGGFFGRGPYKDHLWLEPDPPPRGGLRRAGVLVRAGPEGYSPWHGLLAGSQPSPWPSSARMDREPKAMEKLARRFQKQDVFVLEGEDYKRPKAALPAAHPLVQQKSFALSHDAPTGEPLWSYDLVDLLLEGYEFLLLL